MYFTKHEDILSISNDFQAKIKSEQDDYNKTNFLSWNSSISYDALKDSWPILILTSMGAAFGNVIKNSELSSLLSNVFFNNNNWPQIGEIRTHHEFVCVSQGFRDHSEV